LTRWCCTRTCSGTTARAATGQPCWTC
jgi:hypothetical protein